MFNFLVVNIVTRQQCKVSLDWDAWLTLQTSIITLQWVVTWPDEILKCSIKYFLVTTIDIETDTPRQIVSGILEIIRKKQDQTIEPVLQTEEPNLASARQNMPAPCALKFSSRNFRSRKCNILLNSSLRFWPSFWKDRTHRSWKGF